MPNTNTFAEPSSPARIGRVLVVGGSGKLGRLLAAIWAAIGQDGIVWQHRRTGPLVFDPLTEPRRFAAAADGADTILNLAGVTGRDGPALALNADLALAALEAAREAGAARVLLASSAAVYGVPDGPVTEDQKPCPVSGYGRAKHEMERAARAWREAAGPAGPEVTILRIGNVAGADQLLGTPSGTEPQPLDVFPDGKGPARSYIGPGALARVLSALFERSREGKGLPELLNVALPGTVAMDDLLEADGRAWQARAAPGTVPRSVELDVTRLQAIVPWLRRADAEAIVGDLRAVMPKSRGRT